MCGRFPEKFRARWPREDDEPRRRARLRGPPPRKPGRPVPANRRGSSPGALGRGGAAWCGARLPLPGAESFCWFVYFMKVLHLQSSSWPWVSAPSECSFLFQSGRRVLLGSGSQKLGTEAYGEARGSLCSLRPSVEFANTRGDPQGLDAEVCALIHGETLQALSDVYGLQPRGSQGSR